MVPAKILSVLPEVGAGSSALGVSVAKYTMDKKKRKIVEGLTEKERKTGGEKRFGRRRGVGGTVPSLALTALPSV